MSTPRQILADVAADYHVTAEAIRGEDQRRLVVLARQAAMARLIEAGYAPGTIGQLLGGRHRTTVHRGVRRHRGRA